MIVALEVTGLRSFLAAQGQPLRFAKDVLKVGRFVLPDGRELEIHATDSQALAARKSGIMAAGLPELARNTNARIALGHKVWFPEGDASTPAHNSVASLNRGYWSDFRVEGDRLVATVEVTDEKVAAQIGKTIRDVSAGVVWGDLARASSGQPFGCAVEHVCATSYPVVPQQNNFEPVRLAREVFMTTTTTDATAVPQAAANLAAATPAAPSLLSAVIAGLGLPEGTDEAAAVAAFNDYCAADAPEVSDPADVAAMAKDKTALEEKVAALEKKVAANARKSAEREVDLAKDLALKTSGLPVAKDVADQIVSLLANEATEQTGRLMLSLATQTPRVQGTKVETTNEKDAARLAAEEDEGLKSMLLSLGKKPVTDSKGRLVRKADGAVELSR